MSIERIEIECAGQHYIAEAEIVLRGAGARRQHFRGETRGDIWHQIEDWLATMAASIKPAAPVNAGTPSARRGPGRPPKYAQPREEV